MRLSLRDTCLRVPLLVAGAEAAVQGVGRRVGMSDQEGRVLMLAPPAVTGTRTFQCAQKPLLHTLPLFQHRTSGLANGTNWTQD